MKTSLNEDELYEVHQKLMEALRTVERIVNDKQTEISYETMQKSGFNRSWKRNYSLTDARKDAASAASQLRTIWELIDPL